MAYKKISEKALASALKLLENNFGKEFAEKGLHESDYKAIPTGYDDLDSVLTRGQAGICLGGVCELFGGEGSGKCVTKETMCITPQGLMSVEEIFEDANLKCDNGAGFRECEYPILNDFSQFEKTSHFYKNGMGGNLKTIRIETKDGFTIEGTHNHPVLIMDETGSIVWRRLGDIQKDDCCCVSRGMHKWPDKCKLEEDDGALVGYLLSDGTLGELPQSFSFTNTDEEIVSNFKKCLESCFGSDFVDNLRQYGINYKLMKQAFGSKVQKKYGLSAVNSPQKTIPRSIRCSSKNVQAAFIRAYFDGDGTFQHTKMNLQFCSASLAMLRQLQLMLLNFGIYGYITSTYNNTYDRDYYELEFAGIQVWFYLDAIGFNCNEKSNKIRATLRDREGHSVNTNIDTIPYQIPKIRSLYSSIDPFVRNRETYRIFKDLLLDKCQLTYSRLSKILNAVQKLINANGKEVLISNFLFDNLRMLQQSNFVFSAVNNIEHQNNRTYDFTLPKTHSFWSNGFISHNTSIAMRTIGIAQKLGLNCAWFDAEHSFSPDLAKLNHVDLKALVYLRRTVGEGEKARLLHAAEVLHRIFNAVWTGAFSLIVVDSVAALMPERIVADDFDPTKKGISELARDMSSHLPKISSACAEKECTVIFINQVRMKPGERYGDPFETPGGKALKFYASQRICINKIAGKGALVYQAMEDGTEEVVGHYARVWVKKNRRNEPCFDTLEIPIYYREYFPDSAKICYDLARKLQVIKTHRGILTWKVLDGDVVVQAEGESNILQFIRGSESQASRVAQLAHCCVEMGESEKNTKKKIPIKVAHGIKKLASEYKPEPKASEKATKKSTNTNDELNLDE